MDTLHHVLLGWVKKSIIAFKKMLRPGDLRELIIIMDDIQWKDYKNRTNKNTLLKAEGQVGRNLRALMQVLWYPLYTMMQLKIEDFRVNHESTIRILYMLGKLTFVLQNEHQVLWTPWLLDIIQDTIDHLRAFFHRDWQDIVAGAKTHDLQYHLIEDIKRHGSPSGFSCHPGKSQKLVQKLKVQFSNKHAPSTVVAKKIMNSCN